MIHYRKFTNVKKTNAKNKIKNAEMNYTSQ